MGTVGRVGIFALSAGVSAIQCPIMKGTGCGGCSKRKSRTGSIMLEPVDKAEETVKLSGRTLGKIYMTS